VLDEHPALSVLSEFNNDLCWVRAREADGEESDRSMEFLEMLTDAEVADRAKAVRHTQGWPGGALQTCTAYSHDALVATGTDCFGYGIVAATCQVCSYRSSEHAAYELNLQTEWKVRWKQQ
jgi:hypothetical protein